MHLRQRHAVTANAQFSWLHDSHGERAVADGRCTRSTDAAAAACGRRSTCTAWRLWERWSDPNRGQLGMRPVLPDTPKPPACLPARTAATGPTPHTICDKQSVATTPLSLPCALNYTAFPVRPPPPLSTSTAAPHASSSGPSIHPRRTQSSGPTSTDPDDPAYPLKARRNQHPETAKPPMYLRQKGHMQDDAAATASSWRAQLRQRQWPHRTSSML